MTTQQILGFYTRPAAMTSVGKYAAMLKKLPKDVVELTRIVQGLAIHEFVYDTSPKTGKPLTTHQWYDGTQHPWEFKRVL